MWRHMVSKHSLQPSPSLSSPPLLPLPYPQEPHRHPVGKPRWERQVRRRKDIEDQAGASLRQHRCAGPSDSSMQLCSPPEPQTVRHSSHLCMPHHPATQGHGHSPRLSLSVHRPLLTSAATRCSFHWPLSRYASGIAQELNVSHVSNPHKSLKKIIIPRRHQIKRSSPTEDRQPLLEVLAFGGSPTRDSPPYLPPLVLQGVRLPSN